MCEQILREPLLQDKENHSELSVQCSCDSEKYFDVDSIKNLEPLWSIDLNNLEVVSSVKKDSTEDKVIEDGEFVNKEKMRKDQSLEQNNKCNIL